MGWTEAANLIVSAISDAIEKGFVTYDLARGRDDATTVSTSNFSKYLIDFIEK